VNTARRQFDKGFEIFEFNSFQRFGLGRDILRAAGMYIIGNQLRAKSHTYIHAANIDANSRHNAIGQSF